MWDETKDQASDRPGAQGQGSTCSADAELRWYVVCCKPRQDQRAQENLERQGFHCYRPVRQAEKIRERHRCTVSEPLFPGYVFIHLNRVNDNWHAIRSTRGVNHIVRFNEYPLPVRDEIIEGIRARLAGPERQVPYLQPGQQVRITEGAFAQLEGIFVASDGDERVVLLLNILQTEQRLSFPVGSVSKVR
jgi:transcriptional antiterminator RfaH